MTNYTVGQIVYLVSGAWVHQAKILKLIGNDVIVAVEGNGGIRIRQSRLYATFDAADRVAHPRRYVDFVRPDPGETYVISKVEEHRKEIARDKVSHRYPIE